jgi:hypothetical protein
MPLFYVFLNSMLRSLSRWNWLGQVKFDFRLPLAFQNFGPKRPTVYCQ